MKDKRDDTQLAATQRSNADRTTPLAMGNFPQGVFVNVTDDGKGTELELQ
jgi:hypothetical protein